MKNYISIFTSLNKGLFIKYKFYKKHKIFIKKTYIVNILDKRNEATFNDLLLISIFKNKKFSLLKILKNLNI